MEKRVRSSVGRGRVGVGKWTAGSGTEWLHQSPRASAQSSAVTSVDEAVAVLEWREGAQAWLQSPL